MIVNVCGTHSNVAQKRTIALLADRVINVILYDYKRLPQRHTLRKIGYYLALPHFKQMSLKRLKINFNPTTRISSFTFLIETAEFELFKLLAL